MSFGLLAIFNRVSWADHNIEVLKGKTRSYLGSNPCRYRGHFDPQQQPSLSNLTGTQVQPDVIIGILIGDIVHELRSSLDHLADLLVRSENNLPTKDTAFPILEVGPTANKKGIQPAPGIAGGISATASALIKSVQPYELCKNGGAAILDQPLFRLQRLWNIDKHRHMVVEGVVLRNVSAPPGIPAFDWQMELVGCDEYRAYLRLVPDDPNVNVDLRTTVEIVISDPDVGFRCEPVEALLEMAEAVRDVITDAKETCF